MPMDFIIKDEKIDIKIRRVKRRVRVRRHRQNGQKKMTKRRRKEIDR